MSIPTIDFDGETYPEFQAKGNAAKFAMPFALEVCKGLGYDIGYGRPEWKMPHAIGIDPNCPASLKGFDAMNLPDPQVDFIFSSHCLEHLDNWIEALDYWWSKLKIDGVMFLYLPHFNQKYWRPWNNRKHKHALTPEIIKAYFDKLPATCFISEEDLNSSFMVMVSKDN